MAASLAVLGKLTQGRIQMIVDLRSDVLTRPSKEMIEAMTGATFGDDVFCEDETTTRLEQRTAALTGKEAAIFVASGTMANQLAIAALTTPHDEILLDSRSHIFFFEQGAPAVLSGVQLRPIPFHDCLPDESEMRLAIRPSDVHHPKSKLLCLEVTHNYNGGQVANFEGLKRTAQTARELGLLIHIDGARIFNASIATGIPVRDYASLCDTMMFCFSKGLGTPVGSILVGSKRTIDRARYFRKGFGGGWRQPGMLAAAASFALDHNVDRLIDDHRRASALSEAIAANSELTLTRRTETNMVFFSPKNGNFEKWSKKLTEKGILQNWQSFRTFRMVTHMGITDEMIGYAIEQFK